MTSPLFLNAFYEFGNKIGPILTWVFILLMTVELIYVMAKYLGGGDTNHHTKSTTERDVRTERRG